MTRWMKPRRKWRKKIKQMSDVFSPAERSAIMSRVRSHGNATTELRLLGLFRVHGIKGWRRKQKILGRPDFVFKALKIAIFVDGCFWHGCTKHRGIPTQNRDFWVAKITRNVARDRAVGRQLRKQGWTVVRIWEHDLRAPWRVIQRLQKLLKSG